MHNVFFGVFYILLCVLHQAGVAEELPVLVSVLFVFFCILRILIVLFMYFMFFSVFCTRLMLQRSFCSYLVVLPHALLSNSQKSI